MSARLFLFWLGGTIVGSVAGLLLVLAFMPEPDYGPSKEELQEENVMLRQLLADQSTRWRQHSSEMNSLYRDVLLDLARQR